MLHIHRKNTYLFPTRFHSPTFYIFTVLSIFLNNTFLQMTLESVNYAIFNKYQPTFYTSLGQTFENLNLC